MSGIHNKKPSFSVLATEVVKTREVRNILDSIISDFFTRWGEKGKIKSEISKHAKRIIRKKLTKSQTSTEGPELLQLFQHPDVVKHIEKQLPALLNTLIEIVQIKAVLLEDDPEDKQLAFFNNIFDSINSDKLGRTLTSLAGTADSLHQNNPTIFSDKTVPILRQFLENIDLGEIKVSSENSSNDIESLITNTNDLLFEYPAKLILMLSFIPEISNHLLFFLEDLLKRFNALPADILTDILISFFKEVDGKTVGNLLNNLTEFIRQVHTGSALIGDAGSPQFSIDLTKKARTILNEIEPELLFKSGNALIDGKETLLTTMYDAALENPEFAKLALKHMVEKKNSKNRVAKRKFEIFDELCEEDTPESIATGVSELNAAEFAETINSACSLANRLHQHSPDVLNNLVTEFVNTLDLYEIEESLSWISRDLTQRFKPVIQTVAPVVIKDIIGCLMSETTDNDEQINSARKMLRQFIMNEEIC